MNTSADALRRASEAATQQGGVLSRQQATEIGLTRGQVRAQLAAGRWRRVGTQSFAVHCGPLPPQGQWWAAVFEAGPRAALDGASALLASGLQHFSCDAIRVSVPRGARVRRPRGLQVRQTRRLRDTDIITTGIPRVRPPVAAVRAGLWAVSDKQAAFVLTATAQQGLATPEQLATELLTIRRARRRRLIGEVIVDLMSGVRALGELEFAKECRDRGLPAPTRQSRRRTASGSWILDAEWKEWGLVVEVDGVQHSWASTVVADALRHNDVTLSATRVLRLPLLGLRVAPEEFFAQIKTALISGGCPLAA